MVRRRNLLAVLVPIMVVAAGAALLTLASSPAAAAPAGPVVGLDTGPGGAWLVDTTGGVVAMAGGTHHGSATQLDLAAPVVDVAAQPSGRGYWLAAADGGVFTYGAAAFHGSAGALPLVSPVVGMATTPSGRGYWLVAADGGIFTYGDAPFLGSMGGVRLVSPVVGMAPTPSGRGYWLVAADGGVFSFGDASFLGSAGGLPLVSPVVGMAATPPGRGYWLVAADGGVFTFGRAAFMGSLGNRPLRDRIGGMAAAGERGYVLVDRAGRTTAFGTATDPGDRTDGRVLQGFTVVDAGLLGPGVTLRTYRSPDQVVSTVEVAPGAGSLRVVPAAGGVLAPAGGRGTTTSALCRAVGCVAAVNGDFFDLDDHEPYGAVVVDGELWRTPRRFHPQLYVFGNGMVLGAQAVWPARVLGPEGLLTDPVDAVNRRPEPNQIALFNSRAGTASPPITPTPPAPGAPAEEVARLVARLTPAGPLQMSTSRALEAVAFVANGAATPLGPDTVVLVGRGLGARRLGDLWQQVQQTQSTALRLDLGGDPTVAQSVGGSPVLIERPLATVTAAAEGPNPRTAIGQRRDGTVLMAVVDGRGPGRAGVTVPQLSSLVAQLGAVGAINMDGGGSATLVGRGSVRNAPSDGGERRVANAVVVLAG
jgi:Phosphodiester glycosidase